MPQYNLTAQEINHLPDDEARDLFCDLAAEIIGSDRWVTDLAIQLGMDRRTVQQWKGGDRRVPTMAIVAVSAILRAAELDRAIVGYAEAHEALIQLGAASLRR